MMEEGKEFFKREVLEEFFKVAFGYRDRFFEMADEFETMDFAAMSDEELIKVFTEFTDVVEAGLSLYHQSQHEPMVATEERIVELLSEHFKDPRTTMLTLIEPYELDDINNDEIHWLTLLSEKEELTKEDWLVYMKGCSWNTWNSYDYDALFETYKTRFAEEKGDQQDRIVEMKERKAKHKKEVQVILDKVNSDELQYLVEVIHRTTLGRMRIKPLWAGAEFFSRRMLDEIAKRIGEDVRILREGYQIHEIVDGIKKKTRVSAEELARRREAFFLGFSDGEDFCYSGKEAMTFVKERFPQIVAPPKSSELQGTPASKGKATGRVRILLSENIEKLKEVASRFEDGDILVADMTQPASVVLMQRAGAIVTDEGGLTSHAAVVSREFGKPCIVGTHSATEAFKDGDLVEVDAEKGIVRKV
ncbi:hypothetical protein GOV07_02015 [Candidatus Woesearchaeota archaeon]|nr:hypothetical protein [Candidatus Woesearchaeota archaeon]